MKAKTQYETLEAAELATRYTFEPASDGVNLLAYVYSKGHLMGVAYKSFDNNYHPKACVILVIHGTEEGIKDTIIERIIAKTEYNCIEEDDVLYGKLLPLSIDELISYENNN